MDDIDRKLISILQRDARLPLKDMAKQVFMSPPAVSARIEKLEQQRIITGYSAEVDPLKAGYHIIAFINLEMEPKQKPVFNPFISSCRNVLECNCVTGKYCMLIKVAFSSTLELDAFIGRLQEFGSTSTQIVFSSVVPPRGVDVGPQE
jgi:Lrp/AsnC family leucine-responsive transcriptional regulator